MATNVPYDLADARFNFLETIRVPGVSNDYRPRSGKLATGIYLSSDNKNVGGKRPEFHIGQRETSDDIKPRAGSHYRSTYPHYMSVVLPSDLKHLPISDDDVKAYIRGGATLFVNVNDRQSDEVYRYVGSGGWQGAMREFHRIVDDVVRDVIGEHAAVSRIERTPTLTELQDAVVACLPERYAKAPGDRFVRTPLWLINDAFDDVPRVFWRDPQNTVLCPCGGEGTFYFVVAMLKFAAQRDPERPVFTSDIECLRDIVTRQLTYCDNDPTGRAIAVTRGVALRLWQHMGLNECDFKLHMWDALRILKCRVYHLICMNPPYNGMKREDVPEKYEPYVKDGFRTYYPFMGLTRHHLVDGGKMVAVVPHKWMSIPIGQSLRAEMRQDGAFTHLAVVPPPQEWLDVGVNPNQVSVYVQEKGRHEHAKSVVQHTDGAYPTVATPIDADIMMKVLRRLETHPGIEFWQGSGATSPSDDGVEATALLRYNQLYTGRVKISKLMQERIDAARARENVFICYPDSSNVPFKRNERARVLVQVVEPMPVHNTYVAVPCHRDNVGKTTVLLESKLARVVWRAFFASTHFATALTGRLPDVTSLLPECPTDDDIYDIFELTPNEIECVEEIAKNYGYGM